MTKQMVDAFIMFRAEDTKWIDLGKKTSETIFSVDAVVREAPLKEYNSGLNWAFPESGETEGATGVGQKGVA